MCLIFLRILQHRGEWGALPPVDSTSVINKLFKSTLALLVSPFPHPSRWPSSYLLPSLQDSPFDEIQTSSPESFPPPSSRVGLHNIVKIPGVDLGTFGEVNKGLSSSVKRVRLA